MGMHVWALTLEYNGISEQKETLSRPHQIIFIFTWRGSGGSSTMAFAKEFFIARNIIQFLELTVFSIKHL